MAGGGAGVLTVGTMATLNFNGTIVESGHASFNNNGGVVDPDAVQFTSSSNGGTGLNQYDLYVENIGAVQVASGTGTWDTPMVLTGHFGGGRGEQHRQQRRHRANGSSARAAR